MPNYTQDRVIVNMVLLQYIFFFFSAVDDKRWKFHQYRTDTDHKYRI